MKGAGGEAAKRFLFIIAAVAVIALVFNPAATIASSAPRTHRLGELLIKYRGQSTVNKIIFDSEVAADGALAAYKKNPLVETASRNALVKIAAEAPFPDDEQFYQQWYLQKIRAPEAWKTTQGSRTVVVAVLDTGVDTNHPDLRNNIWTNPREILDGLDNDGNGYPDDTNGWNFIDQTGDPRPTFTGGWTDAGVHHGTMVAGLIGAVGNNSIGVAGTAWYVRLMPIRVLDSMGVGDVLDVTRGIDYAVKNGAQILNLSFVGLERNDLLDAAIARAHAAGVLVVAAAGNDSANGGLNLDANPQYPVCSDGGPGNNNVIGVTATTETDLKASFSGYGTHCVDLAAPGVSIFSTRFENPSLPNFQKAYGGYWQGSSLAAPLVTGAAALIKSLNPALGNDQIRDILMASADKIDGQNPEFSGKLGAGRLNLAVALKSVAGNLPAAGLSRAYLGVAASAGVPGEVKLFDRNGGFVRSFLAYEAPFKGGLTAAAGDLDGDGHEEIVTAPQSSYAPWVRIFDSAGIKRAEFLAYAASWRGGVNVAVGDVDGDGRAEIVTGAGKGGGPHVKVFDGQGRTRASFFAYDQKFRGGVNVAVGDVDGDGRSEIVAGPGAGGGPHVRVFNGDGSLKTEFFVGKKEDSRGLRVAVGDTQAQGIGGIGVFPAAGVANTLYLMNILGVLYGVVEVAASTQNFPFALGDIDGRGRAFLLVSVPTKEGMSLSVYDTDGRERAYALTYVKKKMSPPNPFVVRRP
ncbi:hypothetical protein EPN90_03080 [Patescibacteria group bacterium]|nr:MAG: hypothetical protein EPN90_03080 [Patescibacteria group bacterium]